MKKIYILFSLIFTISFSFAQNEFITTWTVDSGDYDITIKTNTTDYTYNYTVDFGDGTILNNVTGDAPHTYSQTGVYTVKISGDYPHFRTLSNFDKLQLKSIEQWGNIQWASMKSAFLGCSNLIVNTTDSPDLSQVTDMSNMFTNCTNFNQPLDNWDVSNVIDMSWMFYNATSFNQPLNSWDVSNVTNMRRMFSYCSSFNQDINIWDVSNVLNMESMFDHCSTFNQPLNNWDVSSVINMESLFGGCYVFNQPLNNWDTANVTNMINLFAACFDFNQNINNWNVSNVSEFYDMFHNCTNYNQPLNNWDTSSALDMWRMFANCTNFNQPLNNWDVSNVFDMGIMFNNCDSFNQDLSSWEFDSGLYLLTSFLDNTNLSETNYDKLLFRFATLGLSNQSVGVLGLKYCDTATKTFLINQGWNFNGDVVSTNCNTISGSVFYDIDSNGCNSTDLEVSNLFVNAAINNNFYTSGNVLNGNYELAVNSGSYDVTMQNVPTYFTVNPVSTTVDFATTSNEVVDFCLTANQVVEDLNITILPIDEARPGFEANYKILVANVGTEVMTNVIASLNFDDTKQSFVSAVPTAASTTANSLDFSLGTINPFETIEIDIVMQTFTPPTVNGDDILNFTATVLPNASDYTVDDNTFVFNQIVVNAYDPNDKRVVQGEEITLDQTDEYLDYIIRFQNTGSANATFVRIEEQLDQELDWSTIKITSASHPYTVSIINGNDVEYYFDNINLPFEAADPAGSNGYIAYKIKPKSTVQVGDVMSGDASIYFDYNLPIITNVASTTVISNLSVEEFKLESLVSIYPNPVKNELFLNVKNGVTVNTVKIYDLQGHMLLETKAEANRINTDQLATGIYMLTINTNQGNLNKKIIKN